MVTYVTQEVTFYLNVIRYLKYSIFEQKTLCALRLTLFDGLPLGRRSLSCQNYFGTFIFTLQKHTSPIYQCASLAIGVSFQNNRSLALSFAKRQASFGRRRRDVGARQI